MDEVILARHGESELSVVGTVNGDPATACALTPTGEQQARRLGELLAGTQLDLVVTSEFERARQTAEIALAGREVPRLVVPGFNDVRFGGFEGGTLVDYRAWASENEPTVEAPGGGESRSGTVLRYASAYRTVLARPEATILVVAHGLPIRYVLNALDEQDPAPLVEQVAYAEPYRLAAAELERAVDRLERWAAAPVWPE
ncbi:MAG TPA: histidine phosphatase family protein [Gaiellaceae bacterium]|nr:histidine phosphatase family protein [Gaiellaceae bacterium]